MTFRDLKVGQSFRWVAAFVFNGLELDGEMTKTGDRSFGPVGEGTVWDLNEREIEMIVEPIREQVIKEIYG